MQSKVQMDTIKAENKYIRQSMQSFAALLPNLVE